MSTIRFIILTPSLYLSKNLPFSVVFFTFDLFRYVIHNTIMTIVFRNTTMTIGIVLAFCITLGITFIVFPVFLSIEAVQGINILFLSLFSFVCALLFRITFSKTLAPELFFFTIFILTFSFEMFRLLFLYFDIRSYPFIFGIIVTRIVHFGRFLRIFSIFTAGLFACSLSNPKTGIYLGIGILLALGYAIGIPVDAAESTGTLLYGVGIAHYTRVIFAIGEVLSVINFILAGILKNTREYYFMAIAFFITLAGGTMLIAFPQRLLFLAIGVPLLLAGTILFGKRSHELYLWT